MGLPANKPKVTFEVDRRDLGRADTLRYNVMTFVVDEQYDRAIHELRAFLERPSEFPRFRGRVERYIDHAVDLVNAIRAKRNLPGSNFLTMAKQQELNDKFKSHFNELQSLLKRIEAIAIDMKLDDIRSTVWVVRAGVYAVAFVLIAGVYAELSGGMIQSAHIVITDAIDRVTDVVMALF